MVMTMVGGATGKAMHTVLGVPGCIWGRMRAGCTLHVCRLRGSRFDNLQADFFGFDRDLRLVYRGRLDSCGKHPATPDLRRELFDALRQVAAGETAPAAQRPSIGCSIKWRQDA